jgi:hypothetical protein
MSVRHRGSRMKPETRYAGTESGRWTLIRDLLVFQCKLIADGFRDFLLLPVSLIAGLISLLGKGPNPGPEFYDLLQLGRRSERWINLFGALDTKTGPASDRDKAEGKDFDDLVSRVESFLVEEYRKGGVTAQAKQRLDDALDLLQGGKKRRDRGQRIT